MNSFEKAQVENDLINLDTAQSWIRQGWNSDVSLSPQAWEYCLQLGQIVKQHGRHFLIMTKVFKEPSPQVLHELAQIKAEIRVSISALDKDSQLDRRLDFLKRYKQLGGLAVPYLVTSLFIDANLRSRQSKIVEWIEEHDFIGGEQPLRLNNDNPLIDLTDSSKSFVHPKFGNQTWFGRLFEQQLLLPGPPSLRESYPGFEVVNKSSVDWDKMSRHFAQGVPTHEELTSGKANLDHPNLFRFGTNPIFKA